MMAFTMNDLDEIDVVLIGSSEGIFASYPEAVIVPDDHRVYREGAMWRVEYVPYRREARPLSQDEVDAEYRSWFPPDPEPDPGVTVDVDAEFDSWFPEKPEKKPETPEK